MFYVKKKPDWNRPQPGIWNERGGIMNEYEVGDIVETKKPHPCGNKTWEITRVGVDFKLKCTGCGHVVMLERVKALKAIKKKL